MSLDHEREVLRSYANMSAPTVMFVLGARLGGKSPSGAGPPDGARAGFSIATVTLAASGA